MVKTYTNTAGGGSFGLLLFCYFLMGRAGACLKANERAGCGAQQRRKIIERVRPQEGSECRWKDAWLQVERV